MLCYTTLHYTTLYYYYAVPTQEDAQLGAEGLLDEAPRRRFETI